METRPISALHTLPQAPVRAEAVPVRQAVATELPVPKSVTAQVGADQVRGQKSKQDPVDPAKARKAANVTDRETGDMVYQVIDPESRAVLFQSPNEAILKLRAYLIQSDRRRELVLDQEHQEERVEEFHKDLERKLDGSKNLAISARF